MTMDFTDKLGAFWIISNKLDEIQRNISYIFNMSSFADNNLQCPYWKQPHIWALSKVETRIQDAKRIADDYLRGIRKGEDLQ